MISPPTFLGLQITSRCNLSCVGCVQGARKHLSDISSHQLEKMLEMEVLQNIEHVAIVGGEPLLSPHLFELIRVVRDRGLHFESMATNGILIERYLESLITAEVPYINISVDAANPVEYTQRRRASADTYRKVIQNIYELGNARKQTQTIAVSVVVNQENIERVERYIEVLGVLPIQRLSFISMMAWPDAKARDLNDVLLFDTPGNRLILEGVKQRTDYPCIIDLPELISDPEQRSCPLPYMNLTVDPIGNISLCGWKQPEKRFGNLFLEGSSVWTNTAMTRWREGIDYGGKKWASWCQICPYRGELGYTFHPEKKQWIKRAKACV